jgi:pyruvate,water dikinase
MKTGRPIYAVWLSECDKTSLPQVGGKNANLGEMIKMGLPVPPGFAITVDAYREAVRRAGIEDEIYSTLSGLDAMDLESLERAGQKVRELVVAAGMPPEVKAHIREYYEALAKKYNAADLPVAVRSSATAEDLPTASFAGQQDTYLWIKGSDEVITSVIRCWASLFTDRAIFYRVRKGFAHDKVLISVGIQKMVNARAAGVLFTLNPVDGDESKIAIEGTWGLGEAIVSGVVTPDSWQLDKGELKVIHRRASVKTVEHVVDLKAGEVVVRDIPPQRQSTFCLSDEEAIELARIAKGIEQHYGIAQDMEWAIDQELPFPQNMFIVQTRPETVWSPRKQSQP